MDSQPQPQKPKVAGPKIKVEKNGPYLVSGGVPLVKDNEESYPERDQYAICRCGNSKNKPYCDGSHITSGFKD